MPDVSVVMGVFNGGRRLAATLDSVLAQEGCDFEFIVVDDGSDDATPQVLQAYAARDARLRVITQANAGLTRALLRGCSEARGEFIARQDCGDRSLPGRLARQCGLLRNHADAVMVASGVRFLGPGDEPLFVTSRKANELQEGLAHLDVEHIQGPPHHGATMFRRAAYERAGGYRPAFVVAQDIDLWLRLAELGRCLGDPDIAYEATMEAGSISSRRRADQFRLATLAIACARRRRAGGSDADLLAAPAAPVARPRGNPRLERARFYYFVGACLQPSDPQAARRYFWKAFREHPLMLKGLVRSAFG
jgi:glycosyltransferase involved in cell wall biosynthesis